MRTAVCWLCLLCACAPALRTPATPALVTRTPADPFLAEALPLFDGCTPLPGATRERAYRCGGVTAWVAESSEWSPAEALRRGRERLAARLGPDVREGRTELPLAGLPEDTVRLSSGAGAAGFVAALAGASGRTRLVGCVAREGGMPGRARCLELMQYLASRGNPEGLSLESSELLEPPQLPARFLSVPEGCRLGASTSTGGTITCGATSFSWSVFAPTRAALLERWREQTVAELQDTLPGAGPVERAACTLEGLPTACAVLRAPGEDGEQLSWVAAVPQWNRGLLVVCSFPASGSTFPAACNDALGVP
ncbi:hypothetical protein P2318_31725 [Myxococcaceae bacterium GXIMD 01537]